MVPMGMLIFFGVLFILLPLLLLVLGSAAIARFYFFGEAVKGTVVGSTLRVEDDDGQPVDRHYGIVTYSAGGKSHQLDNWGPHNTPSTVGASVVVRYLRKKPEKAMVWPGLQLLWLVVPLTFFIFAAKKYLEWIT